MTRLHSAFILLLAAVSFSQAETMDLLHEDWSKALTEAEQTGRFVYVAFLGEGWSVSCKRFRESVLDSRTFRDFSGERLIYCPVLARGQKAMSKEARARLQALVIHFDIKSYPTLLLIAPDGREILRHGYRPEDAESYVRLLKAILPPSEGSAQESGSAERKAS